MSPGYDGTGPMGTGPFGWRRGICSRSFRQAGFGWRIPVYREPTKAQETEMLKAEKAEIEAELKEIDKRLKELSK